MVSELKGYIRYISEQPPYNLLDRLIEKDVKRLFKSSYSDLADING